MTSCCRSGNAAGLAALITLASVDSAREAGSTAPAELLRE